MDLQRALADPRRYRRQIERLFDRTLFTPARRAMRQDGVPIEALFDGQRRISRLLARAAAGGTYPFEAGRIRRIRVDGKEREVFSFPLTDMIVHAVAAEIVEEASRPLLSSRLFSYRPGISWADAVSGFGAYVRRHRKDRRDPKTRGLYVVRRDIDSYTDSIPVGPASPLWEMLTGLFRGARTAVPCPGWSTMVEVVRPLVEWPDGGRGRLVRGVATGQPISCVLFNVYLHGLDRRLESITGGFYARYSDDILFAHADPARAREAAAVLEEETARLGLKLKAEKGRDVFLNQAARPAPGPGGFAGSASVPFLGTDVGADGTIGLGREAARSLLRDLTDRAERTAGAAGAVPLDEKGRAVCSVLNRALHPDPVPLRQKSTDILRRLATNRPQLRHLDFLMALIAIRAATGISGPRAFRTVPYARVRRAWGLRSLLHDRNRGARRS
ncbi:MAG: reverse transcriptase domain-containing protein [Acidobacteriota bacterium]|nr:reverse transcriptase domain-containing protein [Acidobacteriota bacterium]